MMPLTMRRSSSRSGPVNPLGRCGSIRAHCLSFSQNKPARILSPPNQEHGGKRITCRYFGTDPNTPASWMRMATDHARGSARQNLAMLFPNGIDIEPDLPKAFYWITQAAEADINEAQLILGN